MQELAGPLIIAHWNRKSVTYFASPGHYFIGAFEARYAFPFPSDFRSLLELTDGNAIDDAPGCDPAGFSFRTLQRYDFHKLLSGDFVTFCDYRPEAWRYALWRPQESIETRVVLLGAEPKPLVVAESFFDFARAYVAGSERLHIDGARHYTERSGIARPELTPDEEKLFWSDAMRR
jgi:hypothetical protein